MPLLGLVGLTDPCPMVLVLPEMCQPPAAPCQRAFQSRFTPREEVLVRSSPLVSRPALTLQVFATGRRQRQTSDHFRMTFYSVGSVLRSTYWFGMKCEHAVTRVIGRGLKQWRSLCILPVAYWSTNCPFTKMWGHVVAISEIIFIWSENPFKGQVYCVCKACCIFFLCATMKTHNG